MKPISKGNLTFSNEAFGKILGYPRNHLLGINYRDYTTPDTTEKISRIMEQIEQTGRPEDVTDYDVIRKDGSRAALELSISLLTDKDGKPAGFRGMLRDVTRRKETEYEKSPP